MNINAAATGTGADVTRHAQILVRLVQAVNAGTAQNASISPANSMTAHVIILDQAVLAIRAAAGVAAGKTMKVERRKRENGHIGAIRLIAPQNRLLHVNIALILISMVLAILLRMNLLLQCVRNRRQALQVHR